MRATCPTIIVFSALLAAGTPCGGANWPQFRGPNGSGVAEGDDFPTNFGPATNLLWQAALPPGHSSPCLWGDRIYLTGFSDPKLETLCVDRKDGRVLWRQAVEAEKLEKPGGLGSPAAPTPVTDGDGVYVYFGAFGLVRYSLTGAELWRTVLPPPVTQHGVGSSPVLAGDLLLVVRDQDVDSHLLAVHKQSGKVAWRRERAGFRRGFCTPLVWRRPGRTLLVVPGTLQAVAYELPGGQEAWRVSGLPNELCPSPVAAGDLVYLVGWTPGAGTSRMPAFDALLERGDRDKDSRLSREEAPDGPARQHFVYIDANKDGFLTRDEYDSMADIFSRSQNALLAVRDGGRGDITATQVAWKQTRGLPYVPSPLLYDGRLYIVKDGGLFSCFNATNGAALYQEERLGPLGSYFSSPIAAHGKVCVASQSGVVVVLAAGDTLNVLARNPLGAAVMATPAIAEGALYVRTEAHLHAFRDHPPKTPQ